MQGQLDPPLSARGREQARRLAARLAGRSFTAFYSSDLLRAHQTARALGAVIEMEPELEPRLREIALGAWEGKTRQELEEEFPRQLEAWVREPSWDLVPGGEGASVFERRVAGVLADIFARHPSGDVLCVTHGGAIQVALGTVVGRGSRGAFPFLIQNASLTVVQRSNGRTVVSAVNDTCHLDELR
jgi:probable phosphoglycerate mutase